MLSFNAGAISAINRVHNAWGASTAQDVNFIVAVSLALFYVLSNAIIFQPAITARNKAVAWHKAAPPRAARYHVFQNGELTEGMDVYVYTRLADLPMGGNALSYLYQVLFQYQP